ncbi:uncharacterized protein H6S33_001952 [Morchella sextelata]|uniref:uncharacterized protein n=1 Tax=Morchella sextelata TaxID=1174677 RepID=UPI001D03E965|nr:uncharacterized protein H6S33_001952 [Morchella sextelata]KAH0607900.1 hypothetical protein H6S33_001952 [Morchella sextelata]
MRSSPPPPPPPRSSPPPTPTPPGMTVSQFFTTLRHRLEIFSATAVRDTSIIRFRRDTHLERDPSSWRYALAIAAMGDFLTGVAMELEVVGADEDAYVQDDDIATRGSGREYVRGGGGGGDDGYAPAPESAESGSEGLMSPVLPGARYLVLGSGDGGVDEDGDVEEGEQEVGVWDGGGVVESPLVVAVAAGGGGRGGGRKRKAGRESGDGDGEEEVEVEVGPVRKCRRSARLAEGRGG